MRRTSLLATTAVGTLALVGLGLAAPAAAQTATPVGSRSADQCPPGTPADQAGNCTAPAQANPSPANPTAAPTGANGQPEEQGPIVVTGTRIRTNTYNTTAPVDVITRDDTILAGARSTSEVLQSAVVTSGTAQINNAFIGYNSDNGQGANTVGLRGLGAQRTLVLLNGRRLAPAGVGPQLIAADLNVLPTALVQRIEVLREGASSVYGSDAIAGVINIITDTRMNGVTLDTYTNQPSDDGRGGRTYRASLTAGHSWSTGHVLASFEYRALTEMKLGDRPDTRCPTDLIYNPATGAQVGQLTPDQSHLRCFPFENGNLGAAQDYMFGFSFTSGQTNRYTYVNGDINRLINVNNFDVRPLSSPTELLQTIIPPIKTYTGYVNASWQPGLPGDSELYGEALFTHRRTDEWGLQQLSFNPLQLSHAIYGGTYAGVPLEDYGFPVSPFFPNSLASPANGTNNEARFFIVPQNPVKLQHAEQNVNYVRGDVGIRGNLGIGDWRYDANYMYSRTDGRESLDAIDLRRMEQSLDPVLAPAGTPSQYVTVAIPGEAGAGGHYTCASNVTAGAYNGGHCVAADFFAPSVLAGNVPANLLDWLYGRYTDHTFFDQSTAQIVVDGSLFHLQGGPVKFSVGAEYRYDRILDTPPEIELSGNFYNGGTAGITKGSDRVLETFGELNVPILRDKPFFYELSLTGSARYTRYRNSGSDTTYHAGASWAPSSFLRFRGNYGTSFRAPNLYEQFVAGQSGFYDQSLDPCNNFATTVAPNSNRYKNCLTELTQAIGATKALAYFATDPISVLTQGGAGHLKAEHSVAYGFGGVLTPTRTLSLAVDYFHVKVNGEVGILGNTILDRCYDSSEFRSGNIYCTLIGPRETSQGNLTSFQNPYLNIAFQSIDGLDFSLRYVTDLGPGNLSVNGRATRTFHQYFQAFAEEPVGDYNGLLGSQGQAGGPKWVGELDLRYRINNVTLHYGVQYIGPMADPDDGIFLGPKPVVTTPNGPVVANSLLHVSPYTLHTVSIQYAWKNVGQITLGINNLFDIAPRQISSTGGLPRVGNFFNYSGYDLIGRALFLNLTRSF